VNRIDRLLKSYQRYVSLPWSATLPPQQRVWCAVHPPADERRLRPRLGDFHGATGSAGHGWSEIDLTHEFGRWLGAHPYRDLYFANPNALSPALRLFRQQLSEVVRQRVSAQPDGDVLALHGVVGLFGVMRVSDLIESVSADIRGRMLVFFPGTHEGSVYRLLDARDGWNYHAVAIKPDDPENP
jgi:hypothetical protein